MLGIVVTLIAVFVGNTVGLMGWLERHPRSFPAPNVMASKLLVAISPVVFWIPIFGMILASIAIYRAYWLILPDWISFLLATCFFLAAIIALLTLMAMSMIVVAAV